MKAVITLLMMAALVAACRKTYKVEPTFAKPTIAATWAKQEPFYSPRPQVFLEASNTWRSFISFAFTSAGEPDKLGFANPFNAGKGTNALYMNSLYTGEGLTSDSGYYNVTIPKCFQFIPKSADSLTVGTVVVIPQKVKLFRRDKSFFEIAISPGIAPGTYNTVSGVFEVEVTFDETAIGGAAVVRRKYRFAS